MAEHLEDRIHGFVQRWESSVLLGLADALDTVGDVAFSKSTRYAAAQSPAGLREDLCGLLSFWSSDFPDTSPQVLASIIRACVRTINICSKNPSAELVWTGPIPEGMAIRRTEQALVEIVNSARKELWLASYALHEFAELATGLRAASARGVAINLLLEVTDGARAGANEGKIEKLKRDFGANVYTWSHDRRTCRYSERPGVMHCKFVFADKDRLLVTSANLTDAAMVANMELGVAVCDSAQCGSVLQLLAALMKTGHLVLA